MHLPVALPWIARDLGAGYGGLGIAVALFYAAYSIGLVINGVLGTWAPPWLLMAVGGMGSASLSIALSSVDDPVLFTVLWGVNGYLQSFAWPSLVKTASYILRGRGAEKGYAYLSTSWSLGHALVWLLSMWLVSSAGWRICFVINGAILAAAASSIPPLLRGLEVGAGDGRGAAPRVRDAALLALYTALVSAMHSASYGARHLLITYLPSYLEEVRGSMAPSLLLPLAGSVGMVLLAPLFTRAGRERGPWVSAGLLLATALLLWLFPQAYAANAFAGLLLLAVLSAVIYGNEAQLTTSIPVAASGTRLSSLVAGVVDASGSLGAAVAGALGGACMERGAQGFGEAASLWSLVLLGVVPLGPAASSLLRRATRRI